MMNNLCSVEQFINGVDFIIKLIDNKDEIEIRNIPYNNFLKLVQPVLCCIKQVREAWNEKIINDYPTLVKYVNNDPRFKFCVKKIGKILDLIQLSKLKPEDFLKYLKIPLERTGHENLLGTISSEKMKLLLNEVKYSLVIYYLLELGMYLGDIEQEQNPIKSLRYNMGNRLPEEYFADLLSGWLTEEWFVEYCSKILSLNFERVGIDKNLKILFIRPSSMGTYDLKLRIDDKDYYIELQRVGEKSVSVSVETKNGSTYCMLKVDLNKHKLGKEENQILILWFGRWISKYISTEKCLNYGAFLIVKNTHMIANSNNKIKIELANSDKIFVKYDNERRGGYTQSGKLVFQITKNEHVCNRSRRRKITIFNYLFNQKLLHDIEDLICLKNLACKDIKYSSVLD